MASSSVASPLCTWLVAACMSVSCDKEHSFKSSFFHSPERLSRKARRRRLVSKCNSGSHDFPGGLISGFCGSSLQGLMSSYLAFEPCQEYYSSKGLSSLGFFGDNGFSLFGSRNELITRRQRRMNRAAHSGNTMAVAVEPAKEVIKKKPLTTQRRVVVTGMGVVTPIGHDPDIFYNNLLEGVSGISEIEAFDCAQFPTRIAGEIKSFSSDGWVAPKLSKRADKFMIYMLTAGKKALEDGGITEDVMRELRKDKCGVLIGSAMGGMKVFNDGLEALRVSYKKMNPFCVPFATTNMGSAMLAMDIGWMGPNYSISTACATSNYCILNAAKHIIRGEADMMLCGGSDAVIIPIGLGGFVACRALSERNSDPTKASRPWDINRDGFVMGEGAGVLLLEELEHAKERGANIYAEFLGGSFTCDAHHMTEPHPEGTGIVLCMEKALAQAGWKTWREKVKRDVSHSDEHARLGVQDQKEWLNNEKISIESKRKESPFISRQEKFKNEFLRRVVPWEKITVSWDTFPYYIHEHTKNLLVECAASHLKHKKFAVSYGSRLDSSSGRILLQSIPGTELYRERLVRALARDLQVPLLVLDCSVLAPYDFGEDCGSENESDDDNAELGEECSSESEEDEHDASNEEEWASNNEVKSDSSDDDEVDVQASAEEVLRKLVPYGFEGVGKGDIGESESSDGSEKSDAAESPEQSKRSLKKGDRVKYVGPPVCVEADNRSLSSGQRGEVYEVNGDRVAVILDTENKTDGDKDDKSTEQAAQPSIYWMHVQDIEHDLDMQSEDWYIAMEALWEVLPSLQPLIIYFPDSYQWLSRAVPKSKRKDFVRKVEEMFDQLSGPVVLICGQNKVETGTGSKEKEKFTMILPNFGRLGKLPLSLKRLTEGLKGTKRSQENDLYKLFNNVICLHPPKEEELLRTFNKQIEEDRRIIISRSNLIELHKVLEGHELSCMELLHVNIDGVILTKQKAEKVVGWARNHYLSTCLLPSIKGEKLNVSRESLETAILRVREQEMISTKSSQNLKNLAKDEYETNFVSAVVPPDEIGVMFDDIGALEDVKRTLNELVILPMKRPELFLHGNLLRPCKGILLFGPPGTGKTLLAKALATEAGANFISITGSTLTSKWFGDAEKLTKALFSFASRLAPVIVFVDEIDSLLGARGGAFEHEATRRMRNEFMAAWDGLRSKERQRILILGATNRPFDLDDAVIRRLPRRIYVDLPDADNRMKILKIVLSKENLEPDFRFDELANATEGYSGSDLKNLCIAAAYRPVQEFLEEDKKGGVANAVPVLRMLNLDDFIQAKSKVGASVAYDATSMNELRKWNEQYGEGGSRRKSPFGFGN